MEVSTTETLIPISLRTAYLSYVHIGVITTILVLSLIPFLTRLYIRIYPKCRLDYADFFVILGFMLTITDYALLHFGLFFTPGTITLPTLINSIKLGYLAIPVWGASMTCIKLSVALTLLRIPVGRTWNVFLYAITALQIAYFIGNTIWLFLACQPLAAMWDFSLLPTATCTGPGSARIASNVGSAMNIATDVAMSLAPIAILWTLYRPLRERVLVCGLMALGLLGSAACIVKAVIMRSWGDPTVDTGALAVSVATWTMAEQILALMAACGPSLKGPLEKMLEKFGVFLRHHSVLSFVRGREGGGVERDTGVDRDMAGPVYFQAGDSFEGTLDEVVVMEEGVKFER
jgi:hypothetical protein